VCTSRVAISFHARSPLYESNHLVATSGRSCVNAAGAVADHLSDHTPVLEICERFPCQRAIDLESVDQHGDCDEAVRLDVLVEFV
jgi:hypothetical protein